MPILDSYPVKLLLSYDMLPDVQEPYLQFMLGEFVPTLQTLGVHMSGAWHTAYGDYPVRLVEFIIEDHQQLEAALTNPLWTQLEERLLAYVLHYSKKVVRLKENQFQF